MAPKCFLVQYTIFARVLVSIEVRQGLASSAITCAFFKLFLCLFFFFGGFRCCSLSPSSFFVFLLFSCASSSSSEIDAASPLFWPLWLGSAKKRLFPSVPPSVCFQMQREHPRRRLRRHVHVGQGHGAAQELYRLLSKFESASSQEVFRHQLTNTKSTVSSPIKNKRDFDLFWSVMLPLLLIWHATEHIFEADTRKKRHTQLRKSYPRLCGKYTLADFVTYI